MKTLFRKIFGFDKYNFSRIEIKQSVIEAVQEFAQMTHPKEFVIFLDGIIKKDILTISGLLYQAFEASTRSTSFHIMLPTSSTVYGTIHSHPIESNRPSRADLRLFSKYGFVHGIIKFPYEIGDLAVYDKHGEKLAWTRVD